ncbi:glycoside hydrolase family 18 protein [Trichoderma pleuroticola]
MLSLRQQPLWLFATILLTALFSDVLVILKPVAASPHHHHGYQHHVRRSETNNLSVMANLQSSPHVFANLETKTDTPNAPGQGDFTCGPDKPCFNNACCGDSGWCGYGPIYCGKGCQSNCDAVAECGKYAKTLGAVCPLNVCCSEFGFCGTTADFCSTGCQSHCVQPKPSGTPGNTQKRIIGYWEAWNSQHPCGNMDVGEIPVTYLTHLNVAFGYISQDLKITNMDGNLKAQNPSLKVIISLGGWAFSDPGPWRSVFPTLAASSGNRSTFIQNLLGFLSEYGYDGVDWEYPGADDRGGSDADAANYVALLKDLREAINTSGKDYIITFTAPTSYWYLRHFDINGMAAYADWINLMSYDLHGIWDSKNPIGSQVLAHTNLTEIDLALDLFWRAEVKPSSIVLGLAFYGRTFHLKSASCWKPGCPFSGPGDAGQCTGTAGILSYREVQSILDQTGATSYLDKDAAVRYTTYGDDSWVSYDDETTFQAKIDYANKLGLSGLLIWALDLDSSGLDTLRAVSGPTSPPGIDSSYSLVDLKNLFPTEDLPLSEPKPVFGFIPFGSSGSLADPSPGSGPFGFLLIAGDSHVVAKLRKRDGNPEPMVFLDCPSDVKDQPRDEAQKARVTCLSDDLKECFRVLERGVEGTIVEMPDNVSHALHITTTNQCIDQSIPSSVGGRIPTSPVYDFSFDFNLGLMRRDTNNTSIRLDYSNVKGYWDHLVDTPGIQSRDTNSLKSRFFAPTTVDWNSVFEKEHFDWSPSDTTKIKDDLNTILFWQTAGDCDINGTSFGEGFGAFVQGAIDANFWFGFSMIATLKNAKLDVDQAHGFLKATGQTDLTYGIGGVGDIDISKARMGNPALSQEDVFNLKGHTISTATSGGVISFNPYYKVKYEMATLNGSSGHDFSSSTVTFDGRMTTRIITDLGDFQANFPPQSNPFEEIDDDKRRKNQLSIPQDDVLYGTSPYGGQIAIGTVLTFGLEMKFLIFGDLFKWVLGTPKLELAYNTMELFTFSQGKGEGPGSVCTDYEVITSVYQVVDKAEALGWGDIPSDATAELTYDRQKPSGEHKCYPDINKSLEKRDTLFDQNASRSTTESTHGGIFTSTHDRTKNNAQVESGTNALHPRQIGSMGGWGYGGDAIINPNLYFGEHRGLLTFGDAERKTKFPCVDGMSCSYDDEEENRCCGCASLDFRYELSDMPPCPICEPHPDPWLDSQTILRRHEQVDTDWLSQIDKRKPRVASMGFKKISICKKDYLPKQPYKYPSFPNQASFPWDGIQNGKWDTISKYWGNASASCTNWNAGNVMPADTIYIPNGLGGSIPVRPPYETEHPFEGQLISDFFNFWLMEGRLNDIDPTVHYSPPLADCTFINSYINTQSIFPIKQANGQRRREDASLPEILLAELGCTDHLDRLAIFLARPNHRKGGIFMGNKVVDMKKFKQQTAEEQLLVAKEVGLVFTYLNSPEIWDMFCASYEAMYDHMGFYDSWYSVNGPGIVINFQAEWKKYIRAALDAAVTRSRTAFDNMYQQHKYAPLASQFWQAWWSNNFWNRRLIKLDRVCTHLDKTKIV